MDIDSKQHQEAADSIVLEEEIDPNYVPSEAEVVEYAKWLGMDLDKDQDLFWIAREGLMAPLPKNWKPCKQKDTEDIYYFNFTSGESTWDHPCDGYYKRQYEEHKKKKEKGLKESGDQKRSKAKQDVDQLLGKKKKGKEAKSSSDSIPPVIVNGGGSAAMLERKPLPGISMQPRLMSTPASLSNDFVGSEKVILSVSGDSMFVAKSKTSSKLLAAVAGETADSKQVDFTHGGGEFKLEMKLDSAPLGSLKGSRGGQDAASAALTRRPSSAPVGGGESKDSSNSVRDRDGMGHMNNSDDSGRSLHDLAPLFPRSKALPNLSNSGSNSINRKADSPVNTRLSSPVQIIGATSTSADLRVEQLREDLRRERERCGQLEDDMRALRSKSRDTETISAEARLIAEAATDAIKSDMSSLEFSLRQANNYVADKNAAIESVTAELAKRNQEVQSLSADRSGLQSQLAGLSREISRLTAELGSKTQEATELARELSESRQSELRSKRAVKEQEELVQMERDKYLRLDEALSKTISTLRLRNSDLEVSLSIAAKMEPKDSKDVSTDNFALRDVTALQAEQKAMVATLTSEIAQRDASFVSTQAELTHARDGMAQLVRDLGERDLELSSANTQLGDSRDKLDRLGHSLSEVRAELQTALERCTTLESDGQMQNAQLTTLKMELATAVAETASISTRNEQLSAALEVANSIVSIDNASSNDNNNVTSTQTSLSTINASLIAQVSQLNVRICDLETDLRDSRRKCDQLASSSLDTSEIVVATGVLAIERNAQIELDSTEKVRHLTNELCLSAANFSRVSDECAVLRSELREVGATLESERSSSLQKEKKIRSYQEELLQVQRRIVVSVDKDVSSIYTQTMEDALKDMQGDPPATDTEAMRSQTVIANINSALIELRSVVTAKEDTIAQMTTQIQELRSQLLDSRLVTQSAQNDQMHRRELVDHEELSAAQRLLEERDRALKVLAAKLQMTIEQVTCAETEGNNYRSYWQEAESKLLKAKSSHHLEMRNCESQLSSVQDQVAELQAALTHSNATASKAKVEWFESQRMLTELQSEAEFAQNVIQTMKIDVENLRKALQVARENLATHRSSEDAVHPNVMETVVQPSSHKSSDRNFETTVSSSIVELSIVVGKQQANMTRLEEQLHTLNSKAHSQVQDPHQPSSSNKQHAWSAVASDTLSSNYSDDAPSENRSTFSEPAGRSRTGSATRRNVKFEDHATDTFRTRSGVSHSQQRLNQKHKVEHVDYTSSSADDLTLLSLLRSPPDVKDVRDKVADYISDVGRRIEALTKNDSDSDTIQKILKLEGIILTEAEEFWIAAKSVLRKRSTKISELKTQWKAHNLRSSSGGGGELGMSSALINEQVTDLHGAIKISDELKHCIDSRRHSLRALRETVDMAASQPTDTTVNRKLQLLRKDLRSELRLLITLMARSRDNAAASERDERPDRERGRGGSRRSPKDQSFDDSYIQYDRRQVVDRFYTERGAGRRVTEAPEFAGYSQPRPSDARYPTIVASSLEFPRQTSKAMDQRRLIAQQHIAKIEKQQTDTWKECEDHVNFLTKMRKDLGAVSHSTSGSAKSVLFPLSSHQSERENTANFNCNMLLSGLEADKRLYEL